MHDRWLLLTAEITSAVIPRFELFVGGEVQWSTLSRFCPIVQILYRILYRICRHAPHVVTTRPLKADIFSFG